MQHIIITTVSILNLKARNWEILAFAINQADWEILPFAKNQADWEILAFAENQADWEILAFAKNQADWEILAFAKNLADWEILVFTENQADDRILAGVEIPVPGEKPGFVENWNWKSRRPAYCLSSAESPAADFSLVWLMSMFRSL